MNLDISQETRSAAFQKKYERCIESRNYILQMNELYESFLFMPFDQEKKEWIKGIFRSDFGFEKHEGVFFEHLNSIERNFKSMGFNLKSSKENQTISELFLVLKKLGIRKKRYLMAAFGISIEGVETTRGTLDRDYYSIIDDFNTTFNLLLERLADQVEPLEAEFLLNLKMKREVKESLSLLVPEKKTWKGRVFSIFGK